MVNNKSSKDIRDYNINNNDFAPYTYESSFKKTAYFGNNTEGGSVIMKMKNIYKFAIDGMIDRKKTFIYTLIILIMSMVMMNLVLLQVDNLYYLKLRLNDSFDKNLSEVYYVSTAEDIDETYRSFRLYDFVYSLQ